MSEDDATEMMDPIVPHRDPSRVLQLYGSFRSQALLIWSWILVGALAGFGGALADGDSSVFLGGIAVIVVLLLGVSPLWVFLVTRRPRPDVFDRIEREETRLRESSRKSERYGHLYAIFALGGAVHLVRSALGHTNSEEASLHELGWSVFIFMVMSHFWIDRRLCMRFLSNLDALDPPNPESPPDASVERAPDA